jgi:glutamate--cysteine ligase
MIMLVTLQVLELSFEGLKRRGKQEEKFLEPLQNIANSGVTMADSLVNKFENEWGQSIEPVYSPEFSY